MFIASSSGSSGPKSPEAAGPRTRRCRHARVRSHRSKRHNVTATGNASFGLRGVFECATTPPRSSLPGCLGPYGSEGVRTVGRLHPAACRGATAETTPENQRGTEQSCECRQPRAGYKSWANFKSSVRAISCTPCAVPTTNSPQRILRPLRQ